MTQETVQVDAPETQPVEGEAQTPEGQSAEAEAATESTATEPQDFESLLAQYEADDSPHKASFSKWKEERIGEGWQQAMEHLQPQYDQIQAETQRVREVYQKTADTFGAMKGLWSKAIAAGEMPEEALAQVIESHPDAWKGLQAIGEDAQKVAASEGWKDQSGKVVVPGFRQGRQFGGFEIADFFVSEGAKVLGKPSLASRFTPRITAARAGKEAGAAIVKDFLTEVRQVGYEAGLKDGAKGVTEQAKLEDRKGQRPPTSAGTSGKGRSDAELLADPTTPVSTLIEIRARQKTGG